MERFPWSLHTTLPIRLGTEQTVGLSLSHPFQPNAPLFDMVRAVYLPFSCEASVEIGSEPG